MKILFHDREGKVPATIQQQFEELISQNYHKYRGDLAGERIDNEDVLHRLIFQHFIDSTLIVIDVKEFKSFPKR